MLSDWLYQKRENGKCFDDDAVKYVFWNIECQLERELVEPFYKNYFEIIAKAKETVKESYEMLRQ